MLGIAMPITVAAAALLGATVAGLPLISALLLGAVVAPTDPVLASHVQVGEPTIDADLAPESEEQVRFALTSEGGLNDALAFPFVYLAIRAAGTGVSFDGWLVEWAAWDLVGRTAIGLAVGWLIGRLLGVVSFRPPGRLSALAETTQGFVAVAATLLAYGVAEVLQGYGFLAVFVAAVGLRSAEPQHHFHAAMHGFIEQTENLLVVALLLLFGGALISGVLEDLTWRGAIVAVLLVFVVRPLSGQLSLLGTNLTHPERWAVSFFGIRGFGSVYYLAYAVRTADFPAGGELWATVALAMLISIVAHGISATPAMHAVDRSTGAA
jgi:NhaP-type Na+/H+ or K+/H+ antiporter